ncbi:hypothetical protein [Pusillimonas sp. T7-7]|uniref:hypothetical protein n=1 Tax=Pusillimonas sp. (strain T7-7) TaxID=1007105 RepID=UPI000673D76C|nr:hypothetical protein [Pusillimonas sp. T7-7]
MLHGKELGQAIEQAINLKIDSGKVKSKSEIARDFGVKPPSIHNWVNTGTIGKERLPRLWDYFADVVGPEHWGFTPEVVAFLLRNAPASNLTRTPSAWPLKLTKLEDLLNLDAEQLKQFDHIVAGVLMGIRSNQPPVKRHKQGKNAA